ncbi:MAG: glucose-6-phosphate isomerase [Planctomycetes bacterium]|nr:glucose-6-phosphate isomerase [Planctomycetota bacterium]
MPNIRVDCNEVLANRIGINGIKPDWLKKIEPKAKEAIKVLQKNRGKEMTGWFELPHEKEQVKKILASARRKRGKYEDIVVLGIGGSALGTIALRSALLHPYHNMLDRQMRKGQPRLHIMDNIDPVSMEHLFEDVIDIHKTLFVVISKSGATAETMSQFMLAFELVESCLGERNLKKHLVAITDADKGFLRPIAEELGLESYFINDDVGGRFSVLSPVGLLPAALCGMDVRALLTGAAQMDTRCKTASLYKNPAAMYAAIHYLADTNLKAPLSVMMPYASGLKDVADWYCQLWAESLGKARNRKGKVVNVGPTPIKAVGVTDQHSQVQLYTEGPYDKVVTFIGVDKFNLKLPIPQVFKEVEGIGYLGGQNFNKLMEAERRATQIALSDAGRMNLSITLPKIDANSLGQLFFLFEVATAIAGEFYDIDAYNQPGVEAGKIATYALMGRKGYEKEAKKIAGRKAADKKYIL